MTQTPLFIKLKINQLQEVLSNNPAVKISVEDFGTHDDPHPDGVSSCCGYAYMSIELGKYPALYSTFYVCADVQVINEEIVVTEIHYDLSCFAICTIGVEIEDTKKWNENIYERLDQLGIDCSLLRPTDSHRPLFKNAILECLKKQVLLSED